MHASTGIYLGKTTFNWLHRENAASSRTQEVFTSATAGVYSKSAVLADRPKAWRGSAQHVLHRENKVMKCGLFLRSSESLIASRPRTTSSMGKESPKR